MLNKNIDNSIDIVKLEKNIWVYKNLFNDVDKTLEYFINNNHWFKWYTFGDQSCSNFIEATRFESFPTQSEWNSCVNNLTTNIEKIRNNRFPSEYDLEMVDIFYKTTKNYVDNHKVNTKNWKIFPPMICKYNSNSGSGKTYAMAYHTDYQQEKPEEPGDKFILTCNMYLNDNYDSGEIKFKIFDDNSQPTRITYKPEAGDVIVFPSTPPYYHGVNKTYNGEKYFVRGFWYEEFEGTEEWLKNEQKFGKEEWAIMEKERQKLELKSGMHVRNDIDDI